MSDHTSIKIPLCRRAINPGFSTEGFPHFLTVPAILSQHPSISFPQLHHQSRPDLYAFNIALALVLSK
nr:MAG TPA: hypothetical protein [Caudoviricetes sp.]